MKTRLVWTLSAFLCITPLLGKPPAAKDTKPPPSPTPAADPDNTRVNPTAAWLSQQDGQKDAISLPLSEVIHAITGKNVLPFDPANSSDKAFLSRLGGVMDRVLPGVNRPDSPAQAAARSGALDEVVRRIEKDIVDEYSTAQDFADIVGRQYPSFRLMGMPSGRPYYLAVVLYATNGREHATRSARMTPAFCIDPAEARDRTTTDACYLLIGIEYEAKVGGGQAFLNWDVTDVASIPVRADITFQADGGDVYHLGAILTDGRKGND